MVSCLLHAPAPIVELGERESEEGALDRRGVWSRVR